MAKRPAGAATEPDWKAVLPDAAERKVASAHWRRIAGEMGEREILTASNGHAIQRLVLAYDRHAA